jgi:hypothetical protein
MIVKIEKIDGVDINGIFNDIMLNKQITTKSQTNMCELLFQSKSISTIFDVIINILKNETNEDFDVYIKTIWGYVQTHLNNTSIMLYKKIKDGISPISKYSFIYCVKSNNTIIHLKSIHNTIVQTELNDGDLLIFKTDDFIKDEYKILDRVLLVGSLTNEIVPTISKKLII